MNRNYEISFIKMLPEERGPLFLAPPRHPQGASRVTPSPSQLVQQDNDMFRIRTIVISCCSKQSWNDDIEECTITSTFILTHSHLYC